ncbi:CbtA family protein [Gymnodinialimonas ceratoperidinii]|uniref:CbtA family protein n=1 Tax=Gymnodinialimonas ceratoperidinii TaxID=2856823 RepID=A0A8F6TZP1_9RHOB|nr:CbtA family protein [Gymnodinialimonas ceratoperidinii]QXT41104.1 CbtA family protein [Gymnodinialimonas ceratoperidinii]
MFTRLLTSALFAGAASGLIAALLQLWFVQPVLLHAELYESGELLHFGADSNIAAAQDVGGIDLVRDGLSTVFTMLIYSAYAMILLAAMSVAEERGAAITARTGMIWGIAGFVAVHLAPGFSLAPEVPGVAAADVVLRQVWWFTTAIMAAAAMVLIGFGKNWAAWLGAAVLLLAPHVYGAPEPEVFTGPVPTEIGALFAARALGVGLAAWVLLGLFAGYFWSRRIGATDAA